MMRKPKRFSILSRTQTFLSLAALSCTLTGYANDDWPDGWPTACEEKTCVKDSYVVATEVAKKIGWQQQPLWQTPLDEPLAAWVRVVNDQVLVSTRDLEMWADKLTSFDLATGMRQWGLAWNEKSISNTVLATQPLLVTLEILYPSGDLVISGLDLEDGSRRWSRNWKSPAMLSMDQVDERLLVASGKRVQAVALESGENQWTRKLGSGLLRRGTPTLIERIHDAVVVVGKKIWVLDAANGKIRSKRKKPSPRASDHEPFTSVAQVNGGIAILSHATPKGSFAIALDTKNGKELWQYQPPATSSLVGHAIFGDQLIRIQAEKAPNPQLEFSAYVLERISALTGESVWRYRDQGWMETPPVRAGDRILFAANENLVSLRLDDGSLVYEVPFFERGPEWSLRWPLAWQNDVRYKNLEKLDPVSGRQVERPGRAQLWRHGDRVALAHRLGVSLFDLASGKKLWSAEITRNCCNVGGVGGIRGLAGRLATANLWAVDASVESDAVGELADTSSTPSASRDAAAKAGEERQRLEREGQRLNASDATQAERSANIAAKRIATQSQMASSHIAMHMGKASASVQLMSSAWSLAQMITDIQLREWRMRNLLEDAMRLESRWDDRIVMGGPDWISPRSICTFPKCGSDEFHCIGDECKQREGPGQVNSVRLVNFELQRVRELHYSAVDRAVLMDYTGDYVVVVANGLDSAQMSPPNDTLESKLYHTIRPRISVMAFPINDSNVNSDDR